MIKYQLLAHGHCYICSTKGLQFEKFNMHVPISILKTKWILVLKVHWRINLISQLVISVAFFLVFPMSFTKEEKKEDDYICLVLSLSNIIIVMPHFQWELSGLMSKLEVLCT